MCAEPARIAGAISASPTGARSATSRNKPKTAAVLAYVLDAPGLPLWLLILVLIAVPCFVGLFFGVFAFKGMTPLVFHCHRCGRNFQRKAWRRFPRACARCGARDWNR